MSHKRTAIWAIDAFAEQELQIKGLKVLKLMTEVFNLEIDPVYVLTSGQVQIENELYPEWAVNYERASENLMQDIVKLSPFTIHKKPTVLVANTSSLRGASEELLKYAKNTNARFIFTNSHANKGLPRFFLGSFTETLLLQSTIPVIVSNPTTEIPDHIKHILFPTDFFSSSRKGLEDAVQVALRSNAKLTLYHKETAPLYLSFPEAPFYNVYMEDMAKELKKNADIWFQWAKKQGVNCELVMDNAPEIGPVGKNILLYAEKARVDFICVVTKSSAVGAALLGSTARHLVRNAHCPVWVHHI